MHSPDLLIHFGDFGRSHAVVQQALTCQRDALAVPHKFVALSLQNLALLRPLLATLLGEVLDGVVALLLLQV